ncbi:hypothetical protein QOT17_019429 [Balamuthia mandrillaris]
MSSPLPAFPRLTRQFFLPKLIPVKAKEPSPQSKSCGLCAYSLFFSDQQLLAEERARSAKQQQLFDLVLTEQQAVRAQVLEELRQQLAERARVLEELRQQLAAEQMENKELQQDLVNLGQKLAAEQAMVEELRQLLISERAEKTELTNQLAAERSRLQQLGIIKSGITYRKFNKFLALPAGPSGGH